MENKINAFYYFILQHHGRSHMVTNSVNIEEHGAAETCMEKTIVADFLAAIR